MRIMIILAVFMSALSLQAQTTLPVSLADRTQPNAYHHFGDSTVPKKWFVSTYTGISSSISFFKGGHSTVLAVPLVLQLNRRLSNNWYAYVAVSAAPAMVNFSGNYQPAVTGKAWSNSNFLRSNSLGIYSRAEMGLMYVNDAKTFSISGSIGVENSSYPMGAFYHLGAMQPNPVFSSMRW